MSNEESSAKVQHNGDTHVEILNLQAEHGTKLEQHDYYIKLVLIVVSVQLILTLLSELR